MNRLLTYLRKWKAMPSFGRWYLLKAAFVLIFVKLGLLLLPFHTFRDWYSRFAKPSGTKRFTAEQMVQVARSVNIMADHLPLELLCLPRALAAKYLLRNEPDLTLEIGVELNRIDSFEAHAWVERAGQIIIGDWKDHITYQRIWSWE